MSRLRTYNHTRFDGGMTHNKRDTSDLTKFALLSHLDIYRDQNEMFVMPGYVSDNAYDGSATGLKAYNVRALAYVGGTVTGLVAVSRKLDNTGSTLWQKDLNNMANEWVALGSTTGTDNLRSDSFLLYNTQRFFYLTDAGGTTYVTNNNFGISVTDKAATIDFASSSFAFNGNQVNHDNVSYFVKNSGYQGLGSVNNSNVITVNAKATSLNINDAESGDDQIGMFGVEQGRPLNAQLLLWDSASLLIDQKIKFGKGLGRVIGNVYNIWVGVVDEGVTDMVVFAKYEGNLSKRMSVRASSGSSTEVIYETTGVTNTNGIIQPARSYYRDAMLWYARIPTNSAGTTFLEGLWGCGKASITSPLGVSIPFDTTSLGKVDRVYNFGSQYYFIHGQDGSISRADTVEGTYNVPATIETLIYGADSPYQKELKGVSIVTEDLPAGGSVVCSYRTDEDSAWTTMGTSDETGKRRHSFTKAGGTPIGKFQEIQFKFVITGKTSVKNIRVDIEETNNLPY
jgi:hypothetical protein